MAENDFVKIELTKGYYALIDKQDIDLINEHKWHIWSKGNNSYAITNINIGNKSGQKFHKGRLYAPRKIRKVEKMHRLIMKPPKGYEIDHINGDGLDNRRSNLRLCTRSENMMNRRKGPGNCTSQYKGVYKHDRPSYQRCFQSHIFVNKKLKILGYFYTEKEAALAYNEAAKKYFGEFARLNIIT